MEFAKRFDVIVVGGGHAGTEAALAAARMGRSTLLLTHNIETLGQMSCNPSIGGIGKGHLVKEVDALGGAMAIATDEAGIQFRILNSSKGPAVRATRAQADRLLYKQAIRRRLENQPNLTLFQQAVDDLHCSSGDARDRRRHADRTALRRRRRRADHRNVPVRADPRRPRRTTKPGAPAIRRPSALGARLRELKLPVGRLKTGTPPRLDGRTIDFSRAGRAARRRPGAGVLVPGRRATCIREQLPCWITHTNARTHDIIRAGLDRSPMYTGVIKGVGSALLPVDRGQGRPLRRSATATRSFSSRKA